MNAIKYFSILPICLLTACAHSPQRTSDIPAQDTLTPKSDMTLKGQTTTQDVGTAQNKVMPVEKRKSQTATITSFEIQGALAAKNKAKGWSASMNWVQHGAGSYQIRLMGPLGGGTVVINKSGGVITFKDGNKSSSSSNADELLYKQTGIRLPVNNLYYWVRGLPAPGAVQAEHRDQYNHLVQLRQNGYTINYGKYTSINTIDLPSMIRLDGNGAMIKVIIKNWRV